MEFFQFVLLVILFADPVLAVTCSFFRQRKDGVERSLEKCTGDYCYTYTISILEVGFDQRCVTGIILPTKCWTDRSGTLCVCNTDLCNTPGTHDAGDVQDRIQCQNDYTVYKIHYGGKNVFPYNNYNLDYGSTTCDVQGSIKGLGDMLTEEGDMSRGEPLRESGSSRIVVGTRGYEFRRDNAMAIKGGHFTVMDVLCFNTNINFLRLFYYGGLYVSNFGGHGIRWFARCRTDNCNTWSEDSLKTLLSGIKCKASHFAYPAENHDELGSCEGQMCAVMTSFVKTKNITYHSQFCFSQNSETAEYPILVGHYADMNVRDFAIQNFYLCAEDDCNVDVKTAHASIETYKRSHEDEYPSRKNPLYES